MARLSYDRELLSWSFLPVMLSGLQSGTMAVFVKKTFADVPGISVNQLNFAVGMVIAAKAIGHLTSFLWASVSHGRPKIRFIVWLQVFTAVTIGLMALAPRSSTGLWMVTGLCVAAWTIWSGVITLRTGVWRANYHRSYRARVAGKLSTVHVLIIAAVGALIGFSLDIDPMSYRVLFPALAAIGAIGALFYGRVPFRRHKQHLLAERQTHRNERPSLNPLAIARVLSSDRPFSAYMACMFMMGLGNLMIHAPLVIVLTDQFHVGYQTGIAITTIIPLVCMTLVIPFWGQLLQRLHIVRFRAIHGWTFVTATGLVWVGAAVDQLALLYLAAVAMGVGWGGGVLAWNLGHQHFAPPNRDAEYMGVHVTLTGVRGLLGPLMAVEIYRWLAPFGWGSGVFVICAICNLIGMIGFIFLARRVPQVTQHKAHDCPESHVEPAALRHEHAPEQLVSSGNSRHE